MVKPGYVCSCFFAAYETIPTISGKSLLASGLWGWCRHPNYFGCILIILGCCLTCGTICRHIASFCPEYYFSKGHFVNCLQVFDTVGQSSGRAFCPYKLSYEALAWLSVWREVRLFAYGLAVGQCHCNPLKPYHLLPY